MEELQIITARPTQIDMEMVPHKLYGIISVVEEYSVGIWRKLAIKEIEACWQSGRLPIITGGTGLYIKALMEGLSSIPTVSANIRKEVIAYRDKIGVGAFYQELRKFDSESAKRIHPTDSQRMIRAYEVFQATGVPLSDWHRKSIRIPPLEARYEFIVFDPPRDQLYANCNARLDWMFANGALDEVSALLNLNPASSMMAMKVLGVPEIIAYLRGEINLDDALKAAKLKTRRYAKRQTTWFRNQIIQKYSVNEQYSESLLPKLFAKIFN